MRVVIFVETLQLHIIFHSFPLEQTQFHQEKVEIIQIMKHQSIICIFTEKTHKNTAFLYTFPNPSPTHNLTIYLSITSIQDYQMHHPIDNPILLYIYCLTMRTLKATPNSFNRTLRKPPAADKIVKKSDMKLNDVLINGVRLHCFKVVKNRRIIFTRKSVVQDQGSRYGNFEMEGEGEEVALFKNNAIRRRLKSLEIEPFINKNHHDAFQTKKTFTPYHKLSIDIPPPSSSQPKTNPEQLIQSFKLADLNSKYYSQLKKELMMYSTKNRFNSTPVKRKVEFGKYIGLKSHKQKRYVSQLESNLIQEKIEKFDKEYQCRIRTNPEKGFTIEQEQRLGNSILSQKMVTVNSSQKLKICYSNMFQLKQWKQYPDENVNSMRETCRSVTSNAHQQ